MSRCGTPTRFAIPAGPRRLIGDAKFIEIDGAWRAPAVGESQAAGHALALENPLAVARALEWRG
jgi:hypothetical protein